ncbi:aquaporin, partial [Streptomyces sp. NPDC059278]|uniref:aquaporin n=1 Tax=Streptomyces sp. NPDC059278 TaxID=3346801 RepID=UPI003677FD05
MVGLATAVIIATFGPLSGGSANPARQFGPAFLAQDTTRLWIYLLAPVIGAALGAAIVALVKPLTARRPRCWQRRKSPIGYRGGPERRPTPVSRSRCRGGRADAARRSRLGFQHADGGRAGDERCLCREPCRAICPAGQPPQMPRAVHGVLRQSASGRRRGRWSRET